MPADWADAPTQTGLVLQQGQGEGGGAGVRLRLTYANCSAVWLLAALAATLLGSRSARLGSLLVHGKGGRLGRDCTQE